MSHKNQLFHAYRTVAPSVFGATVRPLLVQILNINAASIGSTVTLDTDKNTGFLTFRLKAAYTRPHYKTARTKAAAEQEMTEIIAHFHQRQAHFWPSSSPFPSGKGGLGQDLALPPLFPDYLKLESLNPVYYEVCTFSRTVKRDRKV